MTVTGQRKRCPFLFYTRALPKLLDKYNNELIATNKQLGEMEIGVEQSKVEIEAVSQAAKLAEIESAYNQELNARKESYKNTPFCRLDLRA